MKYFIGIVPPEIIYNRLFNIQQRYGDNRLEPHVTLRPPVSPTDDAAWLACINKVAGATEPFEVNLPGTGNFGKRVLFVSVESPGMNAVHTRLISSLKDFEPAEPKNDAEDFHPHLTLGRAWCGFSPADFVSMRRLADEYLVGNNVNFTASHIRIYHKPDFHRGYQTYKDIPLGATL